MILFPLTGQYMAHIIAVPEMADGQRMIYRSSHLYLLLISVLHLAWATALVKPPFGLLQKGISLLLTLSFIALHYVFFIEAASGDLERLVTSLGLYGIFAAGVLMAINLMTNREPPK